MSGSALFDAGDFRLELSHYIGSVLRYAVTSAQQDERNAVLPRRELNRLVRLQIPEFFRIASLDSGVDRFEILRSVCDDLARRARVKAVSREHVHDLADTVAREIWEQYTAVSTLPENLARRATRECLPIWDALSSVLVYALRVRLLRPSSEGDFERVWWEDRAETAMHRLATWMRSVAKTGPAGLGRVETAIACVNTDACHTFVVQEFTLTGGSEAAISKEGSFETLCQLVRYWGAYGATDDDVDSRLMMDLALGRLDAGISRAIKEHKARRERRALKRSPEAGE